MAESPVESPLSPQQPLQNSTTISFAKVQTIAQARAELEARLAGTNNDLQLVQTIGLFFLKREQDLKTCFEQLQQLNEQEEQQQAEDNVQDAKAEAGERPLPDSIREQLTALDKELQEGEGGIVGLKRLIDAQLPADPNATELQTSRSGSVLPPSALPSSVLPTQTISKPRRHKVVVPSAASTSDPGFPMQIQDELLNQVRYWTSQAEMKEKLNQEYDAKINEQERIIDALNKQRRLREESEEKLKEDQWNLELQNQELKNQNADLQAQLSKAVHENGKIQNAFTTATEQAEYLKDKEEKTANQLEAVKNKFEQDITALRKQIVGAQREKSDLIAKVDELTAEVSLQQQKLSKKATLEAIATAQELEEKEQENTSAAPILIQSPPRVVVSSDEAATTPAAIVAAATEPKIASLARETSFAHQQSIINELQSKLSHEITEKEELITAKEELLVEKEELVKMLADREETIETMRLEGVAAFEPDPLSKRSSLAALGTRHPSELGLPEEAETADNHDLSMAMSDDSSRDFDNGRNSPFPAGGLFAELAQATSQSNMKPPAEYRDQEVMTEPIESWIHTVPGLSNLLKEVPQSKPEESSIDPNVPEATIISGMPGTETKRIESFEPASNSLAAGALVSAAIEASPLDASSQAKVDETHEGEPSSGDQKPPSELEVAAGDVRRHTCDLSQSIAGSTTTAEPLVPEEPKEHLEERPALQNPEDRETCVSYGSAFGGGSNATDTGRICSIYADNKDAQQSVEGSDKKLAQELTEHIVEKPTESSVVAPVAVAGVAAADGSSTSEEGTSSPGGSKDQSSQVEEGGQEATVSPTLQIPPATIVISESSRTTYTYDQDPSQILQPNLNNSTQHHHVITDATGTTIGRHPSYRESPNGSSSSMSTDYNHYHNGRRMSASSNYGVTPTDPTMIQVITQTMIGDYLWKYTRRRMANIISEKTHRRYIWVHPYTKTLYWSMNNPGAEGSREQRAKSAFILAVSEETDENPSGQNSELPNVSLVIQTTNRNLKLKAPTREKHELWFQSISYLLSRPTTPGADLPSDHQTLSEVQANGNGRAPSHDAVLNLRQNEKASNSLRTKGSFTRLQSMFGRNSLSKESLPSSSNRVGSSRLVSGGNHSGITTTAAAGNEKIGLTNSVVADGNVTNGTKKGSVVALAEVRRDSSYKN